MHGNHNIHYLSPIQNMKEQFMLKALGLLLIVLSAEEVLRWLIGLFEGRIGFGLDKDLLLLLIGIKTGKPESGGSDRIAVWMLDPDYDGRSLFPHQVFFPLAGPKDGWTRLARNLKAEIDESLMEAYRGTTSLPFEPGEHRRMAVKIVDDRGIESLKIVEVE